MHTIEWRTKVLYVKHKRCKQITVSHLEFQSLLEHGSPKHSTIYSSAEKLTPQTCNIQRIFHCSTPQRQFDLAGLRNWWPSGQWKT